MASGLRVADSAQQVASELLAARRLRLVSCDCLQSLWAGYGQICRVQATEADKSPSQPFSLILKYINPPTGSCRSCESHARKVLSYQIEQHFYTHLAPSMPADIAVASCMSSMDTSSGRATGMLLTDLREAFPAAGVRRGVLKARQVYAAIEWLARFHGFWAGRVDDLDRDALCRPPLEHVQRYGDVGLRKGGVWLNGGYAYLATRREEYASLRAERSEWSRVLCEPVAEVHGAPSLAELVSKLLAPATAPGGRLAGLETLLHGDVKSENMFTTADGTRAAFYDFQYVGIGLGVCDLAKLFACSVPVGMLTGGGVTAEMAGMDGKEEDLLRYYFRMAREQDGRRHYEWEVFLRHWETALVDWLRFQASWGFWGNTEWLRARVRSILSDDGWRQWLLEAVA